ncbi:uncharacterized protein CLUP02_13960 [Colletotrichum lupini]|uniref:Uncharacterized protein n=1 Tax=Colletotrichum lupini TaxID=145971 RepID=A0A9Q8T5C0_9PEZI|nr:uncharacterized protein CLUP02_13960 [Colletotrichum lupini]UQC88436.1 hypothetical protein CLUP02_13960 [Colletotrichum lupini]
MNTTPPPSCSGNFCPFFGDRPHPPFAVAQAKPPLPSEPLKIHESDTGLKSVAFAKSTRLLTLFALSKKEKKWASFDTRAHNISLIKRHHNGDLKRPFCCLPSPGNFGDATCIIMHIIEENQKEEKPPFFLIQGFVRWTDRVCGKSRSLATGPGGCGALTTLPPLDPANLLLICIFDTSTPYGMLFSDMAMFWNNSRSAVPVIHGANFEFGELKAHQYLNQHSETVFHTEQRFVPRKAKDLLWSALSLRCYTKDEHNDNFEPLLHQQLISNSPATHQQLIVNSSDFTMEYSMPVDQGTRNPVSEESQNIAPQYQQVEKCHHPPFPKPSHILLLTTSRDLPPYRPLATSFDRSKRWLDVNLSNFSWARWPYLKPGMLLPTRSSKHSSKVDTRG